MEPVVGEASEEVLKRALNGSQTGIYCEALLNGERVEIQVEGSVLKVASVIRTKK